MGKVDPSLIPAPGTPQTLAGPVDNTGSITFTPSNAASITHLGKEDTRADTKLPGEVGLTEQEILLKKAQIQKMNMDMGLNPDGTRKDTFKVGSTEDVGHAWNLLDTIMQARKDATKSLATGAASASVANIPLVSGLYGQNRANLQTSLGSIAGELRQLGIKNLYETTGKKGVGTLARSNAEQAALQNSLAPIGYTIDEHGKVVPTGGQPDAEHLGRGLDIAQEIFTMHLARLLGQDPANPAVIANISAAIADPSMRADLLKNIGKPMGPPPIIKNDEGSMATLSTKTKTVVDPALKAFAPALGAMLANPKFTDDDIKAAMAAHNFEGKNTKQVLDWRRSNDFKLWKQEHPNQAYPLGKNFFTKTVPFESGITGAVDKAAEGLFGEQGGRAAETGVAAATDSGTAGLVTALSGPKAAANLALLEQQNPKAALTGNLLGGIVPGIVMPETATIKGMLAQNAGLSAMHGFNTSEKPGLGNRFLNAAREGVTGAATAATVGGIFRAPELMGSGYLDENAGALGRFARGAGPQELGAYDRALSYDRNAPAIAGLTPRGLAFFQRTVSRNAGAQDVATRAAQAYEKQLPGSLAKDVHGIIEQSEPGAAGFLNRPAIDVRNDLHSMATREYGKGIEPIANERIVVTPQLAETLNSEPVRRAIGETLGGGGSLTTETRGLLRSIPQWLEDGTDIKQMPITVDALKNIAAGVDRRANNLEAGSSGRLALRDISNDIRTHITSQFPELAPINMRYTGRQKQIEAMLHTRDAFLSNDQTLMDELHLKAPHYGTEPGPEEFGTTGTGPTPSERAMAIAGAREAVERAAGANAQGAARTTAENIAGGPNQAIRSREFLRSPEAQAIEQTARQKANTMSALEKSTQQLNEPPRSAVARTIGHLLTGAKGWLVSDVARGDINLNPNDAIRIADIFTNPAKGRSAMAGLEGAVKRQKRADITSKIIAIQLANYAAAQQKDGDQ